MKPARVVEVLTAHNAWRRDRGDNPAPKLYTAKEIGEAIDAAIVLLAPGSLADDRERLIEHAALVCNAAEGGYDNDQANEAWRALPDHLTAAIEAKQVELRESEREG